MVETQVKDTLTKSDSRLMANLDALNTINVAKLKRIQPVIFGEGKLSATSRVNPFQGGFVHVENEK